MPAQHIHRRDDVCATGHSAYQLRAAVLFQRDDKGGSVGCQRRCLSDRKLCEGPSRGASTQASSNILNNLQLRRGNRCHTILEKLSFRAETVADPRHFIFRPAVAQNVEVSTSSCANTAPTDDEDNETEEDDEA
jgi:hypothetical protein